MNRRTSSPVPFLMLAAARPGEAVLAALLEAQAAQLETFTGPLTPTGGFRYTRLLEPLGRGEAVFARAVQALEAWAVYPSWMTLHPYPAPIEEGSVVALVTGFVPFWTVSAVRVAGLERSEHLFAFTLRTLPQHALTGAERFCVYRDARENVLYELTALSRPQHPFAKLGAPAVRFVQRRFARDSARSLRRSIRTDSVPMRR